MKETRSFGNSMTTAKIYLSLIMNISTTEIE